MRTEWHEAPPVTADASAEQYWRISSGEQTGSRSLYRKRWWHASGMIAGSERPWHAPSPGWTLRLCIGAYESRTAGAYSAERGASIAYLADPHTTLIGLVIIVASTVAVLRVGSKPCVNLPVCSTNGAEAQQSSELRRSTAQLFCASSLYYTASWLTTIVIICLYWANGEVFSSAQWRVYGAQALILHSNQLVVPLLIGLWWRHLMNGILEKVKTKGVSLDVGSQA